MSIRNGEVSYEKIFSLQKRLAKEMDEARIASALPEQPDVEKINSLLMEIYSDAFHMVGDKEKN